MCQTNILHLYNIPKRSYKTSFCTTAYRIPIDERSRWIAAYYTKYTNIHKCHIWSIQTVIETKMKCIFLFNLVVLSFTGAKILRKLFESQKIAFTLYILTKATKSSNVFPSFSIENFHKDRLSTENKNVSPI